MAMAPWRPRLLQTLPWEFAALDLATPGAKLSLSEIFNFKRKVDERENPHAISEQYYYVVPVQPLEP